MVSTLIEGIYGGRFFGPHDESMRRLSILLEEALLSIYSSDDPAMPSFTANILRSLKYTPFPKNSNSSPYEINTQVPLLILYTLRR